MQKLDSIGDELTRRKKWRAPSKSVFARWLNAKNTDVQGVPGLYLWGGVGRGKTFLCDLFFDSLPFEDKTRLHFHRFMQQIHDDLKLLPGIDDPIERIADDWAARARLLLLDEIHVNDITDAMLLGGLLTALFKRGVTLVTTSNVPPDGLYRDGLQRARFLPAIAQLRNHTTVLEMIGDTDYRLRIMQTQPIYCIGIFTDGQADAATQLAMQAHFDRLATDANKSVKSIELNARTMEILGVSADLIWFSFEVLCNSARSTQDYIEIASEYHTVMISDIPVMDNSANDAARRFVNLIDEFYDRNVKLIVSAQATADQLYTGQRLAFEFERAASRLFEMQSTDYLSAQRNNH